MTNKKDTGQNRRKDDNKDAEGTERSPRVQKALDAGRLNAPAADDMDKKGPWTDE